MIKPNGFDTDSKNEWSIFTRWIHFTDSLEERLVFVWFGQRHYQSHVETSPDIRKLVRPVHMTWFVVTTCSIQLISDRVNTKIAPTSIKWVKETRLYLHLGPTSCYYKSHCVNGPWGEPMKKWYIDENPHWKGHGYQELSRCMTFCKIVFCKTVPQLATTRTILTDWWN